MNAAIEIDPNTLKQKTVGPIEVYFGNENGKYPHGNSFVVNGKNQSVMIDPSLGIVVRKPNLPKVDCVMYSHTHEDHVAGAHLYADIPCYAHPEDAPGLQSMEGLMAMYGLVGEGHESFIKDMETNFYFQARPDIRSFSNDEVFDLGGVTIQVIHTPGHTAGHCCFLVEWGSGTADERLVYLGDIELTGFGPYYGDACSDLEDFERSILKLKDIDAKYWLTFHHKGLIEDRNTFLQMLGAFEQVITTRETRLLEFITAAKTIEEIVDYRIVYRPNTGGSMADAIERRSSTMHLNRLIRNGEVKQQGDRFLKI